MEIYGNYRCKLQLMDRYITPLPLGGFDSDSDDPSVNVRVKTSKTYDPSRQVRALLAVVENPRSAIWAVNGIVELLDRFAAEGMVSKQYDPKILLNVRCKYGERGNGLTPLIVAVIACDVGAAAVFIRRGAKIDRRDRRLGLSPLCWAAMQRDNACMIKLLLQNGATVHFRGFDGRTPLSIALSRGLRDENARCIACAPMHKWMKLWRPVHRMRLLLQNATTWVVPRSSQLLEDQDTVVVEM